MKSKKYPGIFGCWPVRIALLSIAAAAISTAFLYSHYARITDRKLARGPFADTSNLYASPELIAAGEELSPGELVARLRRAGYGEGPGYNRGEFHRTGAAVEIRPGRRSHLGLEPVRVQFKEGKIAAIESLLHDSAVSTYTLDPQLITNVSDRNREKRQLVRFSQIPPVLVHAVVSAEDKRFFQHGGFDAFRILKAAYVDVRRGRKMQGASTLTMQLARSLWLDQKKSWIRKVSEAMITLHLERKLTKEQIFEDYANEVYLGRHGTFSTHGFGEGALTYFDKDIRRLTLPEAATLAGLVQRPSYYDPYRNPTRTLERRNRVLALMKQNGFITGAQYKEAAAQPLGVAPYSAAPSEAPYLVDLLNGDLIARGARLGSHDVYTTVDLDLQRAASQAIAIAMPRIDAALRKRGVSKGPGDLPQVALVALDPATGAIRALVGGRDYRSSQFNHALADRQPGSVFKPFVFAAALSTGVTASPRRFTTASILEDVPTTFWFNKQAYDPGDFHDGYEGEVTLRQALSKSINVPTVQVAEAVGYGTVARLARSVGLEVQATPAMALGSYESTPLEMAGAYTMFANQGAYVKPHLVSGTPVQPRQVLDPRVAYLMVNLMEDVMRTGTAAAARASGFAAPAAGKTGTSRDGWFAGFTSNLLCVVWVGFDDNRDLTLEGSRSALPVWVELMKRATKLPAYRTTKGFPPPRGIVSEEIDPETGELATAGCLDSRPEYFIAGTQPETFCEMHAGRDPLAPTTGDASEVTPALIADR